jgi:NAD(P)-dependent dehydrogenase (short-subunit alcohol dehydrogenase family)
MAQRVALITGGMGGLGETISTKMATAGYRVAITYSPSNKTSAQWMADMKKKGFEFQAFACDVTDYESSKACVSKVAAEVGPVDILVNNAGNGGAEGMGLVQFRDSDPSGWAGAINVNLFGVLHCSRAVINGMCERGFGRVITISSGAGITGLNIGVSPYAAGKGGAISFMRHLAAETARFGVTANSLALGMMQPANADATAALVKQIPVRRTGTPEDVGAACVYLGSDEASWMTGQTLHLDGGSTFS